MTRFETAAAVPAEPREDSRLDPLDRAVERTCRRRRWVRRGVLTTVAVLGLRLGGVAQAAPVQPVDPPAGPPLGHELPPRDDDWAWPARTAVDAAPTERAVATAPPPRPTAHGDDPAPELTVYELDIAAGRLGPALKALEAATGVEIEISEEAIALYDTAGITGRHTLEEALAVLLAASGTRFERPAPGRVLVTLPAVSDELEVPAPRPGAPYDRLSSAKHVTPLLDTPQSVTVVSEETLEEQGATTLRDVFRNVSGISLQAGEGGVPAGDNLSIRGFSARTDFFVDGVRDLGGYSRDPYNLERVEVVKGPASAYGGRGSTGGSVNLVTKTPTLGGLRDVELGAGSSDYRRATLDANLPLPGVDTETNGPEAFRVNAMWTHEGAPGRDAVENERWGLSPSLALTLGDATQLTASYSHLSEDGVPDYGIPWVPSSNTALPEHADRPAPVSFDNFYGLVERDYEKTRTGMGTVALAHHLGNGFDLRSVTRHGETRRDSIITAPRFEDTDTTLIRRTDMKSRDQTDSIFTQQVDLLASFETGPVEHRLVTGVEVGLERSLNHDREEIGPEPPATDLFDPDPFASWNGEIVRTGERTDADARTAAAYAFDTVDLGDRWQLSGGLRWDRFDLDFGSPDFREERVDEQTSWRAGVVYKPVSRGSVYASAGTSFNPSAEGLSLRSREADLEPESSRSFELGTKWDLLSSRLGITAALFRTEKTNAQTPGIDPGDPPTVLDGEQRVQGAELSVDGRLGDRWSFAGTYTWMDSEVEASNRPEEIGAALANTPQHSASAWASWHAPGGFQVAAGSTYVGDRTSNNRGNRTAPEYVRWDAALSRPVGEHLSLRLNLRNVTDERYIERVGGGHFIPGPGRSVALSTALKF